LNINVFLRIRTFEQKAKIEVIPISDCVHPEGHLMTNDGKEAIWKTLGRVRTQKGLMDDKDAILEAFTLLPMVYLNAKNEYVVLDGNHRVAVYRQLG
jgi:hypothetical protein